MNPLRPLLSRLVPAVILWLGVPFVAPSAGAVSSRLEPPSETLARILQALPTEQIPSGILYDRVLPISHIENYDGSPGSKALTLRTWRQILGEIVRASLDPARAPELPLKAPGGGSLGAGSSAGEIPLAVLDFGYERIRPDALAGGALKEENGVFVPGTGDPFETRRVFAATALTDHSLNGSHVVFRLGRGEYLTNRGALPRALSADFGDGRGFVPIEFDRTEQVGYVEPGRKTIRLRAWYTTDPKEAPSCAAFFFDVPALLTPAPNDTLAITADIPYLGGLGSGQAYVDLAPGHTGLANPVIIPEGFDLDNTMNWPELYALLNQEDLLETLRSLGFDAVVLNFTDATDYIQRNAFALVKLIQTVQAAIPPEVSVALVGPSMGGLVSRYALTYMEANGLPHRVRNLICFDAPNRGADIPLGIQYWVDFFADQSSDAAALLAALDSPAARQLLVYHHSVGAQIDPLRAQFLAELAAQGGYPALSRRVAIANGSGEAAGQGFNAGDQIILYEYRSWWLDITGDVWAVPAGWDQTIFHGLIDYIILPPDEEIVNVSTTDPYDNAPGGYRNSMAQMDSVAVDYGDIIALHDDHCFIPTISSLDVDTTDLFYNIAGDPDILGKTPFQAVYYPAENQEHVTVTAQSVPWFLDEIETGASVIAANPVGAPVALLRPPDPNPFFSAVRIRFRLPHPGPASLSVFDLSGRRVALLARDRFEAGDHVLDWDGRTAEGLRAAAGTYFLRLAGTGFEASAKITKSR
jgi:pimeloyl-ACP methyl ester carboxylesterase